MSSLPSMPPSPGSLASLGKSLWKGVRAVGFLLFGVVLASIISVLMDGAAVAKAFSATPWVVPILTPVFMALGMALRDFYKRLPPDPFEAIEND